MLKNPSVSMKSRIADNTYRYYYDTMIPVQQDIYDALLNGFMMLKDRIHIRFSNADMVWDVYHKLCYDNPEVFFIKKLVASINPVLKEMDILVEYRFKYDEIIQIFDEMETVAYSIWQKTNSLSEVDTLKILHDYLVQNVRYKDLEAPYSHEAPGSIIYGIGVCEGISKAFKYLSDRCGLRSIVAIGEADGNNGGGEAGHAWNIVYIANQPYHIDVTFDYSLSHDLCIRYDYYLLSDKQVSKDHRFENLPLCNRDVEYYALIGNYAKSKRELVKMVKKSLVPEKVMVCKLPDFDVLHENIADQIIDIVSKAVPIKYTLTKHVKMTYNLVRMIFTFELVS